jgi:phosphoglycerate dehydrogenase-like enzyme
MPIVLRTTARMLAEASAYSVCHSAAQDVDMLLVPIVLRTTAGVLVAEHQLLCVHSAAQGVDMLFVPWCSGLLPGAGS